MLPTSPHLPDHCPAEIKNSNFRLNKMHFKEVENYFLNFLVINNMKFCYLCLRALKVKWNRVQLEPVRVMPLD